MSDFLRFGEEKAREFGCAIVASLAGKTVSKLKAKTEDPGGLIYEAQQLDMNMWDLLEALEGMCGDGRVEEIDDSTYYVKPAKEQRNENRGPGRIYTRQDVNGGNFYVQ